MAFHVFGRSKDWAA